MRPKALAVTLTLLGAACAAAACSAESSPENGVAEGTTNDSGPPDGALVMDATPATSADAREPAKPPQDGGRFDAGPVCTARCEKARCPDVEACAERCAKQTAAVPASCATELRVAEECAETGVWECKQGEAEAKAPCLNEGVALLNCVLSKALDASSDADR